MKSNYTKITVFDETCNKMQEFASWLRDSLKSEVPFYLSNLKSLVVWKPDLSFKGRYRHFPIRLLVYVWLQSNCQAAHYLGYISRNAGLINWCGVLGCSLFSLYRKSALAKTLCICSVNQAGNKDLTKLMLCFSVWLYKELHTTMRDHKEYYSRYCQKQLAMSDNLTTNDLQAHKENDNRLQQGLTYVRSITKLNNYRTETV